MFGVLLIGGGLAVGLAALLWPNQVEQVYGDIQIKVGQLRAQNETPVAKLGGSGGKAMVDRCDGTFTEMTSYEREGVPPVWAAHNNCGGDIILPLEIGDEIILDRHGDEGTYRVVDVRETPKVWVTTAALIGLQGELALQSCFYGGADVPMKFIGLEPVAPAAG